MESIISQVEALAANTNELGRQAIQRSLRDLQYSLETPYDTAMRFTGLHLQVAMIKVGVDLGLFPALTQSKTPVTVAALAEKTSASSELLRRVLRYLASTGTIAETGTDTFAPNSVTRALDQPVLNGGINHLFNTLGPAIQATPDFLKETNYQNITSNTHTPFQKAFNTDLACFDWFRSHPEEFEWLHQAMRLHRGVSWLDVFPVDKELGKWSEPEKAVFVDVGGGLGQQIVALKEKYPAIAEKGKLVLQDLPETIAHVKAFGKGLEGIELVAQDFHTPQAVKGARIYYLRNILHDYPDDICVTILGNIRDTMGPESVILVDDCVLTDTGVPWQAAVLDLAMMTHLGALERTRGQWDALFAEAGLKIREVVVYNATMCQAVSVVVKA
ncbi:S-adenosyl-L-methionine-dependent methyltransferase [Lophium mytilinum]|uniref:S-adenosyl-L-methionine-dependent methyltransferase n=1 Tax=Lophium mytilinum TaxID=390894 RepID=A0A6A6R5U4_9PEZI|nr:S-adenosyl-L-methionine-dependent methyltransferase [Lophium mytilinum]